MVVGSLNIIAGIVTTVSQYLKISELNESNRVAYLSWGKFYRDVKTELLKHPLDRMRPKELRMNFSEKTKVDSKINKIVNQTQQTYSFPRLPVHF